jgi:hypothetical protein
MGSFWLLWGVALLLPLIFPTHGLVRFASIIFVAAFALTGILMKPLIRRWKERITFPRTGYIELRQPSRMLRIGIVIATGLTAFTIALLARSQERTLREWVPLGLGLLMAASIVYSAWKMRSPRLALFSFAIAAAAAVTFLLHSPEKLSYAVTILTAGVVCLADGLLTLRTYLRAHPAPSGDAQ